jgi:hypothetical protein
MRLLITILLSVASLLADNGRSPCIQPNQVTTDDHKKGIGTRSPAPRRNPCVTHSVPNGSPTKPVHVRQYKRKDGTVVRAHDRAAPGTANRTKRGATFRKAPSKAEPHEHPK